MNPIDIAAPRVQANEGYRSDLYNDSLGNPTIGYGCLCRGWSQAFATDVMHLQLEHAEADCDGRDWYEAADAVRQSVLLELAFNMGITRLLGFHLMLTACAHKDWETAGAQLQNSAWFHQVGARGPALVKLLTFGG
jgi:lysozyme